MIADVVYGCATSSYLRRRHRFPIWHSQILQGSNPENEDKDTPAYQMFVNTNLTGISDWLTKIIVGLGPVKLKNLPPYLTTMATSLTKGIMDKDRGDSMAFAYGTICFFLYWDFYSDTSLPSSSCQFSRQILEGYVGFLLFKDGDNLGLTKSYFFHVCAFKLENFP